MLLSLVIVAVCMSAFTMPTFAATVDNVVNFSDKFTAGGTQYDLCTGLVNEGSAQLTKKATAPVSNKSSLKVTPANSLLPAAISHNNIPKLKYSLSDIAYIRYNYNYSGTKAVGEKAKIVVKASLGNLSKDIEIYSMESIESGKNAYLTFPVNENVWGYILPGGLLPEVNFYPFGDIPASSLTYSDEMYLVSMGFHSFDSSTVTNGIPRKYPVYFEPGRADVTGEKPETIYAAAGETITLPQNTFKREGYSFKGWICSDGSVLMSPGDKYTLSTKTINTGTTYTSARTYFVAEWVAESNQASGLPSVNVADYSEFTNGIAESRDYASYTKNVTFDGVNAVRFDFYPSSSSASTSVVTLDGWSWRNLPLDFTKYKYAMVLYYYDTDKTSMYYRPRMKIIGSSGNGYALSSSITINAKQPMSANKWDIMCFEFDIMKNYPTYIKSMSDTVLNQIQFMPFGATYGSNLAQGDKLYVASWIFLDEVPTQVPTHNNPFIKGYEDGTFRPNNNLTNAEAAVLVTRAMGLSESNLSAYTQSSYSDISDDSWYFSSVAYLESIGALTPKSGDKFYPSNAADNSEFMKLLVKAKMSKNGDTESPDTNIPDSSTGTLSRAQAIVNINTILNDKTLALEDAKGFGTLPFPDVTDNQWYYPDVALGAKNSVTFKNSSGTFVTTSATPVKGVDLDVRVPSKEYRDTLDYIKQLDKQTTDRITEIRNTESEYTLGTGGTVYYISSSYGSKYNLGISQKHPKLISKLDEVSKMDLNPGDVVLFYRGDTFRGSMTAKAGVTYSAYGTGDKPVLTRSPENGSGSDKWTLIHEDEATGAKIWKYYADSYVDVGGINLIDSSGNHTLAYKNVPDYKVVSGDNRTSQADYVAGEENFWVNEGSGKVPATKQFSVITELDHDLEFVHFAQYRLGSDGKANYSRLHLSSGSPNTAAVGPLYLRCDAGNPGSIYPDIQFNLKTSVIVASDNGITFDNLCIKYFGSNGISSGKNNLTVRNCEIGWGGGSYMSYGSAGNDAYRPTRFGNGIEIYGGLVNYVVDNCYIYQLYDAGVTHQVSASSDGNYFMEGVHYTNNVLTHCTYNIEYFMSANSSSSKCERLMKDIYFTDNIIRYAGYGWGVQRPSSAPANIKGWTHHNFATNFVIEDNVIDRCIDIHADKYNHSIHAGSTFESSIPYFKNNTFIQVPGRKMMTLADDTYNCAIDTESVLNTIGGEENKLYFYPDDMKNYKNVMFWQ